MEVSIKFTTEELVLIYEGLKIGSVHHADETISEQMHELSKKIMIIDALAKQKN